MTRAHLILFVVVLVLVVGGCQANAKLVPADVDEAMPGSPQGQAEPLAGTAITRKDPLPASENQRRRFVPLDNPVFIEPKTATLNPDDLVLGFSTGKEARAYPITMMRDHHIINDEIQGNPLLVTY